jgi:hypothetical protein
MGNQGANGDDDDEEEVDSDNDKDSNAIDMRREDAELEKILREYNNESRASGRRQQDMAFDRPLDLAFYKGIQLPQHLNWVTIHTVIIDHVYNYIETKRECSLLRNSCFRPRDQET